MKAEAKDGGTKVRDIDQRQAFTLIELLVVILLIGILVALLLPAFSKMKEKVLINRAETEAKSLANAIRAYHQEYGKWPVPGNEYSAFGASGIYQPTNNKAVVDLLLPGETNPRNINFVEAGNVQASQGDPFRSNFAYRVKIDLNQDAVMVISSGPDCREGTSDDIMARY